MRGAIALVLVALILLPLAPAAGWASGSEAPGHWLVEALRLMGYGDGDLVSVKVYAYKWAELPGGLREAYTLGDASLYVGAVSLGELAGLLGAPGVLWVEPAPLAAELRRPAGGSEPAPLAAPAASVGPQAELVLSVRAPHLDLIGARAAWELGYTGEGTVIGVVDTGVDFSAPGLGAGKIAYDPWGLPLSVSGFSVLAAPLTLIPIPGGLQGFDVGRLYFYLPPDVYKASSPIVVVVYYKAGTSGYAADTYTLREPELPAEVVDAYQRGGAPPRYGLATFVAFNVVVGDAWLSIILVVPGLVADVQPHGSPDGIYDTVYLDFSTALAVLAGLLSRAGIAVQGLPELPDYSFADEKPVTLDDPVVGYDPDGDGEVELGFGSLAGYFADTNGFVIPNVTGLLADLAVNMQNMEYVSLPLNPGHAGLVWPGLDFWRGSYAAFLTDYHGHGTLAAYTAAGKPFSLVAPDGGGILASGVAPDALIAGSDWFSWPEAPMLWSGLYQYRLDTGEPLWLPPWEGGVDPWEGIDPASPPPVGWSRLRQPLVDAVTNSWGFVASYLYGGLPGLDGASLVMDSLAADGGPLQFFANGNSGPGFHTAGVPASSASVVAVGAVTELSFKDYMGLYFWWEQEGGKAGPPGQPAFFTSRGPALAGWPRPEVSAVGWRGPAVGRSIDTLRDSSLGGGASEAFSLFSGTSMATPQAAGAYLLLAQAARELGLDPRQPGDRDLLRAVLAASAEWRGLPVEAQGSGIARADRAVELLKALVQGSEGYAAALSPSGSARSGEALGVQLPPVPWIHVVVPAGGYAIAELVLVGRGSFTLEPARLSLEWRGSSTQSLDLKALGYYGKAALRVPLPESLPSEPGVLEVRVVAPYRVYDAGARTLVAQEGYSYAGGTLVYVAPDGSKIVLSEAYNLGNTLTFTVSLEDAAGLLSQGGRLEVWLGLGENRWAYATEGVNPFTVETSIYTWRPSELVESVGTVSVDGSAVVELRVRGSAEPGVHAGAILVYNAGGGLAAVVPYTVAVALTPGGVAHLYPKTSGGEEYMEPLLFTGGFSRGDPESPDWRVVPVLAGGPALLVVEARWQAPPGEAVYASNFDAVIYAPAWSWVEGDSGPVMETWVSAAGYELTDWYNTVSFWDGAGRPGYMRLAAPIPQGENHLVLLAYNVAQLSGFTQREPLYLTVALLPVRALPAPQGGGEVMAGITAGYPVGSLLQRVTTASAIAAYTGQGPVWASEAGAGVRVSSNGYTAEGGFGFFFTLTVATGSLQPGDTLVVELSIATYGPVKTMGGLDIGVTRESRSTPLQLLVGLAGQS